MSRVYKNIDEAWLLKNVDSILDVFVKLKKTSLSDYQAVLKDQGKQVEILFGNVLYFLALAERWYREKRGAMIENIEEWPKGISAYERECVIKGKTAKLREVRDLLVGAKIFCDSRIKLIQSYLKSTDEKNKMGA